MNETASCKEGPEEKKQGNNEQAEEKIKTVSTNGELRWLVFRGKRNAVYIHIKVNINHY